MRDEHHRQHRTQHQHVAVTEIGRAARGPHDREAKTDQTVNGSDRESAQDVLEGFAHGLTARERWRFFLPVWPSPAR